MTKFISPFYEGCTMRIWIGFTGLLLFFACSNRGGQEVPVKQDTTTVKVHRYGTFNQYSYAVYLPPGYRPEEAYPLLLALDPHGRGRKAPEMYRKAAAAHGFVLAGLNDFPEASDGKGTFVLQGIRTLLDRYAVDPQRINLFGFSGGARMAGALSMAVPEIRGVVASGAAFDVRHNMKNKSAFHAYLISGKQDFNYQNQWRLARELSGASIDRHMALFSGGHEYPPVSTIKDALQWITFKDMQAGMVEKDNRLLKAFARKGMRRANSLREEGRYYAAYRQLEKLLNFLEGLHMPRRMINHYQELAKNPRVEQQQGHMKSIRRYEQRMQMEYRKALYHKNAGWWKKQVKSLNGKLEDGGMYGKDVHYRLKNYLSMVFFTETRNAFPDNMYQARRFLTLYGLVDPQNPDYMFFRAKLAARESRDEKAARFLQQALRAGFKHQSWIRQDPPLFAIYQDVR